MIDIKQDELDKIIEILNRFVSNHKVVAFGSRVRGNAKKYSDLDIAIYGKEKLDVKTIAQIKEEFEETDIPFRIDILDYNNISDEFKKIIDEKNEIIL